MQYLIPCLSAFCACVGFSLLYEIRGKRIVVAALSGAVAWAVYLLSFESFGSSEIAAYFFAGAAAAAYSEATARLLRMPVTVCLIPGIIPLVPGLTIYRAMRDCLLGNVESFLTGGIQTLKIGGAIVLGLFLISAGVRLFQVNAGRVRRKKQQISETE